MRMTWSLSRAYRSMAGVWLAATVIALAGWAHADAPATGSLLCEFWKAIPGGDVNDLMSNPAFPAHPTATSQMQIFEYPVSNEENWGVALRGYVSPPTTGAYTFWISCDDGGTFMLSTDDSPDHRQEVCSTAAWSNFREWEHFPSQRSKPITLTAGKRYYVEAFGKNFTGSGHLSIGWTLPDGTQERPIPGNRLSPAVGPSKPMPPVPVTVALDPKTVPATTTGFHKFPLDATVTRGVDSYKMSYLMYLPKGYENSRDKKALFIFLCGNSHQGEDLGGILNEGPAQFLSADEKLRDAFPMIGLFPQPPSDKRWDSQGMPQAVVALIDEACKKYPRIDRDRIYLTGLSMGGKGTWLVSQVAPEKFALVVPISGVTVNPEQVGKLFKRTPAWVICGGDDGDFTTGSRKMAAALETANDRVQLTVIPNEGHGVWARFYPDIKFYLKLMQFRRTQ